MFMEYPKWKYRGKEARIVENREEEVALGLGWVNEPNVVDTKSGLIDATKNNGFDVDITPSLAKDIIDPRPINIVSEPIVTHQVPEDAVVQNTTFVSYADAQSMTRGRGRPRKIEGNNQ